jgi:CBS domain-containing protein
MTVRELLDKTGGTVEQVNPTATVAEAARLLLDRNIGSLLICEDGRAIGIFTKNDLLRRYLENPSDFGGKPVSHDHARPLFSTSPEADLGEVFAEMVTRGIRHVPVLVNGNPAGIVTPIDILLHMKETIGHENQQLLQYIHGTH